MADKKSDGTGGSSARNGDEDRQDNLDNFSESCKENLQSSAVNEMTDEEVKKSSGEKDVFDLQSESSSEEEFEPEKVIVDQSKISGNVKERLLQLLGLDSSGSDDSDGDSDGSLGDSEVLTNIEGLSSAFGPAKGNTSGVVKKTDAEELDDSFADSESDDEEED